jgi:hypothetical protein
MGAPVAIVLQEDSRSQQTLRFFFVELIFKSNAEAFGLHGSDVTRALTVGLTSFVSKSTSKLNRFRKSLQVLASYKSQHQNFLVELRAF